MRAGRPRLGGAVLLASVSVVVPLLTSASAAVPSPRSGPGAADRPASVTPQVREVAVAAVAVPDRPILAARSAAVTVNGFGVVGATWQEKAPAGLRLFLRSSRDGTWSAWEEMDWSREARPGGREGRDVRSGTAPVVVGQVDAVQMRTISNSGAAPRDLELSVVNPGRTGILPRPSEVASRKRKVNTRGVRAPVPGYRTREQWGANERMRSGRPSYGRITAGIVHHTVNANGYKRTDVPAILRGIYAYHTQSRGWSDIGYNFLVDRFGRKWVGRYGGPRRAVIGAHAYGYNHLTTGIAVIGNYEERRPGKYVKRAVGRLVAWKLGQAGVRVGGRLRWMGGDKFKAISGHRNVGQTACPGIKLYRQLEDVRRIALNRQRK